MLQQYEKYSHNGPLHDERNGVVFMHRFANLHCRRRRPCVSCHMDFATLGFVEQTLDFCTCEACHPWASPIICCECAVLSAAETSEPAGVDLQTQTGVHPNMKRMV